MDKEYGKNRAPLVVEAPMGEKRVLLHACCAPCSSAIVECLLRSGITPTIFYCNPNIHPLEEYLHRRDECARYAAESGLEMVEDKYDHDAWLEAVKGLEKEPERGARCLKCFKYRLARAAEYAAANGFKVLATTLASSRWKSLEQIDEAGRWAVAGVSCGEAETVGPADDAAGRKESPANPVWWGQNWRKDGLQERRREIIREMDFYNQLYCGCEFSRR